MSLGRAGRVALAALLGIAGVVGLLLFFSARDDSTFSGSKAPGREYPDLGAKHIAAGAPRPKYNSDPPSSGAHVARLPARDGGVLSDDEILEAVELGNVVLLHAPGTPDAPLQAVARDLDAGYSRSLAESGAAVLVGTRPRTQGVVAVGWRHLERVADANDPKVADFAEYFLGRGADG